MLDEFKPWSSFVRSSEEYWKEKTVCLIRIRGRLDFYEIAYIYDLKMLERAKRLGISCGARGQICKEFINTPFSPLVRPKVGKGGQYR